MNYLRIPLREALAFERLTVIVTLSLCYITFGAYHFPCADIVCQIMVARIPVRVCICVRRCCVAFSLHLKTHTSAVDDFGVIMSEVPCCSRLNPLGSHGSREIDVLHQV